ncbi:MAG: hypothetical protein IPJ13_14455 [Saprospiraceae bacterium]|nr:hypothetical protein [Saprospiraceae bacterium]
MLFWGAGYTFRKDYDNVFTRYNEGYILRTPSNLAQGIPISTNIRNIYYQ